MASPSGHPSPYEPTPVVLRLGSTAGVKPPRSIAGSGFASEFCSGGACTSATYCIRCVRRRGGTGCALRQHRSQASGLSCWRDGGADPSIEITMVLHSRSRLISLRYVHDRLKLQGFFGYSPSEFAGLVLSDTAANHFESELCHRLQNFLKRLSVF
jgi:hypothetical protein